MIQRTGIFCLMAIAVAVALTFGPVSISAQSAKPSASRSVDGFPAFLQEGTCQSPGKVVAALALVASPQASSSPRPSGQDATTVVVPASVSVTRINVKLDDIARQSLIVRVAPTSDRPAETIACGVIGGAADRDGNLYVTIAPVGARTPAGVAWMKADGDTTTVTLFLVPVPDN